MSRPVSWYDEDFGGRLFGHLLGVRADGTHEVSAGYNGVKLLQPREVTHEEE